MLVLLVAALLLVPSTVSAQPPATPEPPPPPPPLREATAEFAFVGTSGNSSTQSIGVGGELIYRPAPWTLDTKAAYVRNDSQGTLKAESFDLSVKGGRPIGPQVSVFGRYGFLHDLFAGIDQRHVVDAGISYILLQEEPHALTLDATVGYAHEGRTIGPLLSNATAGVGASYRLQLNSYVDATDEARVTQSLSESIDWRAANIAAVTSKLNSVLSLKVSNTFRYVHTPAFGFQPADTITAIALVAKF